MSQHRWAAFVSGRGSNLDAIIDELDEFNLRLVVTNKPSCLGAQRARRAGLKVLELPPRRPPHSFQLEDSPPSNPSKVDGPFDRWSHISHHLKLQRIDRIFLLGFMLLLPDYFVEEWAQRIFNLHPSLLPTFPGLHSVEKALAAGAPLGATVHEVVTEMDAGPICQQGLIFREGEAPVPIDPRVQTELTAVETRLVKRVWRSRAMDVLQKRNNNANNSLLEK